jgi:hypothetical protein
MFLLGYNVIPKFVTIATVQTFFGLMMELTDSPPKNLTDITQTGTHVSRGIVWAEPGARSVLSMRGFFQTVKTTSFHAESWPVR